MTGGALEKQAESRRPSKRRRLDEDVEEEADIPSTGGLNPETRYTEPLRGMASPEESVPAAQSQDFGGGPYIGLNVP